VVGLSLGYGKFLKSRMMNCIAKLGMVNFGFACPFIFDKLHLVIYRIVNLVRVNNVDHMYSVIAIASLYGLGKR
jgi:hypothetical protein